MKDIRLIPAFLAVTAMGSFLAKGPVPADRFSVKSSRNAQEQT